MENRPIRPHHDREAGMARHRAAEIHRREECDAQHEYYERCDKQNAQFDALTSPRYYEENSLHGELTAKCEKVEHLETRRASRQNHDIETMVDKGTTCPWNEDPNKQKQDEIPVGTDIKEEEENHRRRKSEVSHSAQSELDIENVKICWNDQKIEKRVQKEKEEEKANEFILKRNKLLEAHKRNEEIFRKEAEEKKHELGRCLEQQMEEIVKREAESARLRLEEEIVTKKRRELEDLEITWEKEERRRRSEAIALENQKFHKIKLELKAQKVLEELEEERKLIQRLHEAEVCDKIRDEEKRAEVQQSMNEFLQLIGDLGEVEHKRKQHLQVVFDSEAATVFQEFDLVWRKDEEMRKRMVDGILSGLKRQIDEHLQQSREQQKELLRERKDMIQLVNKYKEDLEALKLWEEQKKEEYKKDLDLQITGNSKREMDLQQTEGEKVCDEFEELGNEEVRLKNEMMRIQKGQYDSTHGRKHFFH